MKDDKNRPEIPSFKSSGLQDGHDRGCDHNTAYRCYYYRLIAQLSTTRS